MKERTPEEQEKFDSDFVKLIEIIKEKYPPDVLMQIGHMAEAELMKRGAIPVDGESREYPC